MGQMGGWWRETNPVTSLLLGSCQEGCNQQCAKGLSRPLGTLGGMGEIPQESTMGLCQGHTGWEVKIWLIAQQSHR